MDFNFEAAVFDCDGTLIDSESVWINLIESFIADFGLTVPVEEFRGITAQRGAEIIAEQSGRDATDLENLINSRYSEALSTISEPIAAARSFVQAMHPEVPMAVASNGRRDDVEAMLAATGLRGYFQVVVTVEDVERGKPAPDLYERACQQLRVDPQRTVAFEDSRTGAQAARQAGCTVIGVSDDPENRLEVDLRVSSFDEIKFAGVMGNAKWLLTCGNIKEGR